MEYSSMDSNSSAVTEGLLTGSEEPSGEFLTSIFILHLFIILEIVSDDKPGTLAVPFTASNLLLRASRQYPELGTVRPFDNDVGFLLLEESLDLEVSDEFFILTKLRGDVA